MYTDDLAGASINKGLELSGGQFVVLILYSNTERTLARNNYNLILVLRNLHLQILDETAKADLVLLIA